METTIDFTNIYNLFYKRLYQIGYSITRDSYLAEDVVQETFIKAMKKIETIQEENKIYAWLAVIATRTAIDIIRKEKKKSIYPMEYKMLECLGNEMNHSVEREIDMKFFVYQIKDALKKLTNEYQEVLILKISQGLKEHEIAKVLNVKQSTVKSRIYRARKQLKILFQEYSSA